MYKAIHRPVLAAETLRLLAPDVRSDALFVDATTGEGGHTELFLSSCPRLTAIALDADKERLLAYLRDHIYANATGSSKSRLSAVEKEVYAGTDFIDAACLSVLYELNPFCRGIGNVSACFLPNVCLDSNGLRLSRRENGKEESLILDFADGSSTYASFEIDGCVYRRYSCYVPYLRLDQLPIFGYSLASLCQSSPSSKILLSKFRLNNVISETPVELDEGAAEIFDFLSPHQLPFLSLKGKPKHYLPTIPCGCS